MTGVSTGSCDRAQFSWRSSKTTAKLIGAASAANGPHMGADHQPPRTGVTFWAKALKSQNEWESCEALEVETNNVPSLRVQMTDAASDASIGGLLGICIATGHGERVECMY
jgi:hypothetical protein